MDFREPDYLGDGVYASFDGYHLWLQTNNGYGSTNSIALEPPVLEALDRYRERLSAALATTPVEG